MVLQCTVDGHAGVAATCKQRRATKHDSGGGGKARGERGRHVAVKLF